MSRQRWKWGADDGEAATLARIWGRSKRRLQRCGKAANRGSRGTGKLKPWAYAVMLLMSQFLQTAAVIYLL